MLYKILLQPLWISLSSSLLPKGDIMKDPDPKTNVDIEEDPYLESIDTESFKKRTMVYKKEAIERLKNILTKAGYKIVAEEEDTLMFDYRIPSGHIEFSAEITGWGHDVGEEDKEAGA
jgi:hypothetical protein